jgi:prepilin-type N-terminal cleavage/methylation domain-containing protein
MNTFMKNKETKASVSGFTLIELLVVIAIIGILSTLAIVALQGARRNARDAKRIYDVRQMQTGLELYFNDLQGYPALLVSGSQIASGSNVYMYVVPTAPSPADGDICSSTISYRYQQLDSGSSYFIEFCLGGNVGSLEAGVKCATPGGIISTTTSCD